MSRVKNHNMFREGGQEYDPAQVSFPHRPLATDRSPNRESQMNLAKSQFPDEDNANHIARPPSPSKDQPSPSKSSLSKGSRYGKGFDPAHDIWSEYDIDGHRYAKSVKFDVAPPQVNEYEMRTPDPSSIASGSRENSCESEEEEEEGSFEQESSVERDDSFDASLEDTEKTPVVLPEDWRFMSPGGGDEEESFVEEEEDEHTAEQRPVVREGESTHHARVESLDSNGERRPLPPLPSVARMSGSQPSSPSKLPSAVDLGSGSYRGIPAPLAAASFSKSDIDGEMSLEDRLRLMMLHENDGDGHEKEEHGDQAKTEVDENVHSNEISKDDIFSPPRISRDSILRDIRGGDNYDDDDVSSFDDDSHIASSPHPYDNYDPDVPIPSMEIDDDSSSVIVKEEANDDDLYAIADHYQNSSDHSLSSRDQRAKYDEDSNYSLRSAAEAAGGAGDDADGKESEQTTPVPEEAEIVPTFQEIQDEKESQQATEIQPLDMASIRQSLGRPVTPEVKQEPESEPSTPDSVIRHPVEDEDEEAESSSDESVPEPVATIRAPGAGLKTRPSLTPADMDAMAATRRKISGQHAPPVPALTKQLSNESEAVDRETKSSDGPPQLSLPSDSAQRKPSLMKLDIPFSIQEESLGSGLTKEFDRVIESQKVAFDLALSHLESQPSVPLPPFQQPGFLTPANQPTYANNHSPKQRGYLMRQNTKVVVADNRNDEEPAGPSEPNQDLRGTRSAGSSPRKASQQTWTTVPWNGQHRRPSVKMAGGIPKKKPVPGAVPPLPGQASNVQEAQPTIEENEPGPDFEDGEERGRLFVKVVGIKYVDLPLPRGKLMILPASPDHDTDPHRGTVLLCTHIGQWSALCDNILA